MAEPPSPSPTLPAPADLTGVSYLYGHPLLNSLSPLLHKTIYNALGLNWAQIPLSVSDTSDPNVFPPPYTLSPPIAEFLAAAKANPRFVGASVTMPWKVAILPHLDELAEEARGVGACNTIFIREEEEEDAGGENNAVMNGDCKNGTTKRRRIFIGTNTDCIGIREALLQNAPPPPPPQTHPTSSPPPPTPYHNKPALIIGGGGTARAAIYALRNWLGASKIYIVNRDGAEVEALMAEDAAKYHSSSTPSSSSPEPEPAHAKLVHVTHPSQVPALEPPYTIISGIPNYPPQTAEEGIARKTIEAFLNGTSTDTDASGETPSPRGVILEMCYHPRPWTEIAELAAGAGWKVVLGTEAMIWQGIEQARLWTGREVVGVEGVVEGVKGAVGRALEGRGK
ncbi:hypothetical protein FQN50_002416 [Emmonsiellopsis sp. PD_5]|nr:hypothetical protein FQN50_002416 [Emmonsiellopsis sp. PD_5]